MQSYPSICRHHSRLLDLGKLLSRDVSIQTALHVPVSGLRSLENLPPFGCQLWFPTFVGNLLEKNGLPNLARPLTLTHLLTLCLLKLLFDRSGARVLLRVNRFCNPAPELEGFVRKLFLKWWDDLRRDI